MGRSDGYSRINRDHDLMSHLRGRYEVTLKQVALSEKMMHDGCPVHDEGQCPSLYYAPLIGRQLAQDFRELWARLEQEAHAAGGE